MSKAKAHVAMPAVSSKSLEIAAKIASLINSRPTTPTVAEMAAIIDECGPAPVEFPALLDWRRREAENKATWASVGPDPDDEACAHIDDELHRHSSELMARPVMTWEDVALLGDLAMYWIYPVDVSGDRNPDLSHDMTASSEGFDTQVIAHLLNGIARLTGGRHV